MKNVMKRHVLFLLCLTALLCVSAAAGADYINGDFLFTVQDDTAVITRYIGEGGAVTVPSMLTADWKNYATVAIGNSAFESNNSITGITLPEGIREIGKHAFWNCPGLESVSLPSSLELVEEGAFYYCEAINSVYISGIQSWCSISFKSCGANPLLYGATLYIDDSPAEDIVIPEGISQIKSYAFSGCAGLKSVKLPESLASIGEGAFYYCENLREMNLPSGITEIETYAFYHSGLENIKIPGSVTKMDEYAFAYCENLTAVYTDDIQVWCGIEFENEYANPLCNGAVLYINDKPIKDLVIPEGVTQIENFAFCGCSGIKTVTLPKSLTAIGCGAFYRAESPEKVYISDLRDWLSIEIGALHTNDANDETIDDGKWGYYLKWNRNATPLQSGTKLYVNNEWITSLEIPEGIDKIPDFAFCGCDTLERAAVPEGVTEIGKCAFSLCSGLQHISLPDSLKCIGQGAFEACTALTAIELPEGLENIDRWAFYECTGLKSITLPASLQSMGNAVFCGCTGLTDIEFLGSLSFDGTFMFKECNSLKRVTLPEDMKILPYGTFMDCKNLTIVRLPEGMTFIDGKAFMGCESLIEVYLPQTLTIIGTEAFRDCTELKEITLPESLRSIRRGAFAYTGLTEITIPTGVCYFGEDLFGSEKYVKMNITEGSYAEEYIEDHLFENDHYFDDFDPFDWV